MTFPAAPKTPSVLSGVIDEPSLVRVIRQHRPLLRRLVGRLPFRLPSGIDEDDILQEVSMAALHAFRTYDAARGSLEGWLTFKVRRDIRSWLRSMHPLSTHRLMQLQDAVQACQQLEQHLQRRPSDEELAEALGWKLSLLRDVLDSVSAQDILSIEHLDPNVETAMARTDGDPFERVWTRQCAERAVAGVGRLTELERNVLDLHYLEGMSLREIAQKLGASRSTVTRAHHRALFELRVGGVDAAASPQSTAAAHWSISAGLTTLSTYRNVVIEGLRTILRAAVASALKALPRVDRYGILPSSWARFLLGMRPSNL